jgi:Peptidase inhibitor family I36
MVEKFRRIFFCSLMAIFLITAAGLTAPASAWADSGAQVRVDAYLAAHPGGVQINATEIAYGGGAFVVTVVRTGAALSGPDCPAGWYCFYDGINYTYPRGRLSDCGFQRLSTWSWQDRVESAHYNLTTGSVVFIDETGSTDTTLFSVGTSHRAIADVGTARNRADYVFRYC